MTDRPFTPEQEARLREIIRDEVRAAVSATMRSVLEQLGSRMHSAFGLAASGLTR